MLIQQVAIFCKKITNQLLAEYLGTVGPLAVPLWELEIYYEEQA